MLRQTIFVGLAALIVALPSRAAIIVTATATDVGQGFTSYILRAHSTDPANQTINGIDTPTIVQGAGALGGLPSQVWLNSSGVFKSPTAGDQLPGLWQSQYTKYDSFWFFDSTNSLSVGAPFDESNNGIGGVTGLPDSPLGTPYTGFGAMGTVGGAAGAKSFTLASGKQGADVDLAQVVMKKETNFSFSGTILTSQGNNVTVSNVIFLPPIPDPSMPEPVTWTLLGVGLAGCFAAVRHR